MLNLSGLEMCFLNLESVKKEKLIKGKLAS